MNRKWMALWMAACLTLAASSAAMAQEQSDGEDQNRVITVTGTGTVTVTPDTAQLSLAVQTQATSTGEAQAQNTQDINNVIQALENAGVAEKNIATSGIDIYSNYSYDDNGNGTLSGYTVTTRLTVTNLAVEDVGNLLDVATGAGINQVNDISYSYSDSVTAYDQAMEAALDRAQEKAEKIAGKSGLTLGRIENISESSVNSYDLPVDSGRYAAAEETADASSMKVLAGETTISAMVTVTYAFQ